MNYIVIVGGNHTGERGITTIMTTVYKGEDEKQANAVFIRYIGISKQGFGHYGHENIRMMSEEMMVQEFIWKTYNDVPLQ